MDRINSELIIEELKEATSNYLSVVARLEDNQFDSDTRNKATSLIQETQVQSEIALEQIQN